MLLWCSNNSNSTLTVTRHQSNPPPPNRSIQCTTKWKMRGRRESFNEAREWVIAASSPMHTCRNSSAWNCLLSRFQTHQLLTVSSASFQRTSPPMPPPPPLFVLVSFHFRSLFVSLSLLKLRPCRRSFVAPHHSSIVTWEYWGTGEY